MTKAFELVLDVSMLDFLSGMAIFILFLLPYPLIFLSSYPPIFIPSYPPIFIPSYLPIFLSSPRHPDRGVAERRDLLKIIVIAKVPAAIFVIKIL